MMRHKNIRLLLKVARSIGPLLERVVFVGGATTTLHLSDQKQAGQVRPTIDVDMIIDLKGRKELHAVEGILRAHGYQPDQQIICRHSKDGAVIDLMPTDERILGFSNRWYKEGIKHAEVDQIDGVKIRYLSFPFFIATKLEAFNGRGNSDFYDSKDMEDIITVLAGRVNFLRELSEISDPLKSFIVDQIARHLENDEFISAISAHFPRVDNFSLRVTSVVSDLKAFADIE